jgi:hypothetical protein
MSLIERDSQGVDRCRRVVTAAVAVDQQNPAAGFKRAEAYCNKPATMSVEAGRKVCPSCDKQPPVGNINPRITNAAGITLTAKELQECGVKDGQDPSLKPAPEKPVAKAPRKTREAKKPVEGKMKQLKDVVQVSVTLDELEQTADVARLMVQQVIAGMDKLPVTNFADSKRLIKLQERLAALLEA